MDYTRLAFNLALLGSAGIFVGLLGFLLYKVRPFTNFERGIATLFWSFPASVLLTMILIYLNLPYFFLSLFGGPGLSALLVPPARSKVWRALGGILLALSIFITLVVTDAL